jgi:ABC-type antimicrobial peptide transport system permease subunit
MPIFDTVREAWSILTRNKVRSFLTMLGIIIGVTSVVVIMSVGAGAQGLVLNQVKSLGSNLVGVLPGKSDDNGPPASVLGIIVTTLTTEDSEAFVGPEFPYVSASTPYVRGNATFTSGDNQTDANYVGVAASYPLVEEITVANGRFFTAEEDKGVARVAVLGSETAEKLFGDLDPVGRLIKIKRVSFRVIGVVEKRGVSGFQNQDNQIFVPVTTAQKLLLGINYVNFVRVKVSDAQYVDQTIETMKEVLRARHDIDKPENDDFSVRSTNQGLEALTSITNALKFFLAAIAAISLIVGGIGIMNIMLAAVEERTKEIGLRKAVGATNRIITLQFLIETITITFVGGVIGIILGTLISVLVATVARSQGYVWDLVITPSSIILGCSVSIAIGLIFGITPARRASRLSPIEALRYE